MAASDWLEMRSALAGTLRFACGDRAALACFDRSLDGFWRSFRAAALVYPLHLLLLGLQVTLADWQAAGGGRIIVVKTIAYVISWTAFPLIMVPVTRWLGREERFFDFMVPYNWCQVPQSVLALAIAAETASGVISVGAGRLLDLVAVLAVLFYEWFIARVALQTSGTAAALVVVIDVVLVVLIAHIAAGLY